MNPAVAASATLLLLFIPGFRQQKPEPVEVSPEVLLARTSRWVRPLFPAAAREQVVTGDIQVAVAVDVGGTILSADAVSGPEPLRQAALDAVREWEFDRPVKPPPSRPISTVLTFQFTAEFGGFYATLGPRPGGWPMSVAASEPRPRPQPDEPVKVTTGEGGGMGTGVGTGRAHADEGLSPDKDMIPPKPGQPAPPSVPIAGVPGPPFDGPGARSEPTPETESRPPAIANAKLAILSKARPRYTELARQNLTSGVVRARVIFGSDATIKQISILRGLPDGLNQQAIDTIHQIRFRPATNAAGEPITVTRLIEVEFNIR
jgi:TonB family protein